MPDKRSSGLHLAVPLAHDLALVWHMIPVFCPEAVRQRDGNEDDLPALVMWKTRKKSYSKHQLCLVVDKLWWGVTSLMSTTPQLLSDLINLSHFCLQSIFKSSVTPVTLYFKSTHSYFMPSIDQNLNIILSFILHTAMTTSVSTQFQNTVIQ